MPLERIAEVLDATADIRRALLDDFRTASVHEYERAIALLDNLAQVLVDGGPPTAQGGPVVHSREATAQTFISRTVRSTAADLPSHIERSAADLAQRAGAGIDRSPREVYLDGDPFRCHVAQLYLDPMT